MCIIAIELALSIDHWYVIWSNIWRGGVLNRKTIVHLAILKEEITEYDPKTNAVLKCWTLVGSTWKL